MWCATIEFHRIFYKITANLVQCLSEASFARKVCEQAFCKKSVNEIRVAHHILFLYISILYFFYIRQRLQHNQLFLMKILFHQLHHSSR